MVDFTESNYALWKHSASQLTFFLQNKHDKHYLRAEKVGGSHLELSVASGAVDGDQGGEDAHQEEDQHHVLREPNVLGGGGSGDGEGKKE